jgi:hypothetical protein
MSWKSGSIWEDEQRREELQRYKLVAPRPLNQENRPEGLSSFGRRSKNARSSIARRKKTQQRGGVSHTAILFRKRVGVNHVEWSVPL